MMIMRVTTAMGANTAAIIQRLLGGFLTTAETKGKHFVTIVNTQHWINHMFILPQRAAESVTLLILHLI